MSITLNVSPNIIHSSGNQNWWVWESTMRFAPRFNLRVDIKDQSGTLYNTVLIPTNPSSLNILNIQNIIDDYCIADFNPSITTATLNTSTKQYRMDVFESFEGFYVTASSIAGRVGTVSVANNFTYLDIATPSNVTDIGFLGGTITSSADSIFVVGYGTGSNGFINRFNISRDQDAFIPVTASIGSNSPGYLVLSGYPIYSIGASSSTSITNATKAYIEYLDYNQALNFSGYTMLNSSSKFLTRAPREGIMIQSGELATLSYIQATTQSVPFMYVVDSLGGTYSKAISMATSSIKIDIPSGTTNLGINPNADWYDITLQSSAATASFASLEVSVSDDPGGDWTIQSNQVITWTGYTFTIINDLTTYYSPLDLYTNVILYSYDDVSNISVKNNYNITFTGNSGSLFFKLTAKVASSAYNFTSINYSSPGYLQASTRSSTTGQTAATIYSETFRYYINCLNTRWTPIRLCWMNTFGGTDYYTFKFISNESKRIERSNFDKNLNYGTTNVDRGITTYKLNDFDIYTVVSELLDDSTSDWLTDLFTSKEVFWLRNGSLIPVTITQDSYERNVGLESKELQVQFRLSRTNKK